MVAIKILTVLLLGVIAWEDLRHRAIHWSLLPGLFLCLAVPAFLGRPRGAWYADTGFNLAFLAVQFTVAVGLVMLRHRRWENPVDRWVGLGDLLFLAVLATGLSRWSFLVFYLSGLVLCIPAYLLLVRWAPRTVRSVPLAGFLAIYLGIWMLAHLSGHVDALYHDGIATNLPAHG
ncbi:MAG: hypothetical protein JST66_01780 [Bacteroidetes bacterium]|nr:hypothetical protein [Bacteroidota bacterium]